MAISDSRIIKVEDDKVFFHYKKQKSNRERTMILGAMEFIRRFLQHVLPSGFMKVRYYGFLSPTCNVTIEEVRAKIESACRLTVTAPQTQIESQPPPKTNLVLLRDWNHPNGAQAANSPDKRFPGCGPLRQQRRFAHST